MTARTLLLLTTTPAKATRVLACVRLGVVFVGEHWASACPSSLGDVVGVALGGQCDAAARGAASCSEGRTASQNFAGRHRASCQRAHAAARRRGVAAAAVAAATATAAAATAMRPPSPAPVLAKIAPFAPRRRPPLRCRPPARATAAADTPALAKAPRAVRARARTPPLPPQ